MVRLFSIIWHAVLLLSYLSFAWYLSAMASEHWLKAHNTICIDLFKLARVFRAYRRLSSTEQSDKSPLKTAAKALPRQVHIFWYCPITLLGKLAVTCIAKLHNLKTTWPLIFQYVCIDNGSERSSMNTYQDMISIFTWQILGSQTPEWTEWCFTTRHFGHKCLNKTSSSI